MTRLPEPPGNPGADEASDPPTSRRAVGDPPAAATSPPAPRTHQANGSALRGAPQRRPAVGAVRAPRSAPSRHTPPPSGRPAPAALAELARRLLADAVRVARWAGELPAVDRRGDLLPDDAQSAGRALGMTVGAAAESWERARLVGLVELRGAGAGPGWRLHAWEHDDEAVLRGWGALFDAWTLLVPVPSAVPPALAGMSVDHAPQLLSFVHLVDGPVDVAELLELLRRGLDEQWRGGSAAIAPVGGPGGAAHSPVPHAASAVHAVRGAGRGDQPEPGEVAEVLQWMVDGFAAVGALVRHRPEAGRDPRIELSPLGHWAIRAKLEEICVVAQTAAGHIEQSAAEMLGACAGYTPGPARAEYRAWVAARPVDRAVAELLEVARGDDPLLRGLAFETLRVAGHPAEPAVRAAVDEPTLRPYALLWLAEQADEGVDPSEVLDAEDATRLWVDTGAAVLEHGDTAMLVQHVQGAAGADPSRLFARARATGHPRAGQVLAAVASAHPDPAIARAARRSAFSVHQGGA